MSDTFTEVTRTSWGSRIKNAFGGILFGLGLIVGGIILLFWNEGRTIQTKRALNEGSKLVVSVSATEVNPNNEGKLLHVQETANTSDVLNDDVFSVSAQAIHMHRNVEMYQWEEKSHSETEKKVGGSEETTTTYTYDKVWSTTLNSSSSFKVQEGHSNPASMPYKSKDYSASNVNLGEFMLGTQLIGKIGGSESLDISNTDLKGAQDTRIENNQIYIGKGSPQSPEVGDMRVNFIVVLPKTVSVVARQHGNSLIAYTASNGKEIALLSNGLVPADQMFQQAKKSNKIVGYLVRLGGILMLIIGFNMLFKPLVVLADVLPFLGNLIGIGTGLVSFLLGLSIGLIVIAVAWISYRPFVAIPLLLMALALIVYLIIRAVKRKRTRAAAA